MLSKQKLKIPFTIESMHQSTKKAVFDRIETSANQLLEVRS
jgi:hypothetical protein